MRVYLFFISCVVALDHRGRRSFRFLNSVQEDASRSPILRHFGQAVRI